MINYDISTIGNYNMCPQLALPTSKCRDKCFDSYFIAGNWDLLSMDHPSVWVRTKVGKACAHVMHKGLLSVKVGTLG